MKAKIKLEIGDVTHEMTPEQARELRDLLNGVLGERELIRIYSPTIQPIVTPRPTWIGDYWMISSGDTGDGFSEWTVTCKSD